MDQKTIEVYEAVMAQELRRLETMGEESAMYEGLDGIQDALLSLLERGEDVATPDFLLRISARRQAKRKVYRGQTDIVSMQTLRRHDDDSEDNALVDISYDGSETTATALHDYIYNRLETDYGRTYADIYDGRIYRNTPYRRMVDDYRNYEGEPDDTIYRRMRQLTKKVIAIIVDHYHVADLFDTSFIFTSYPGTCKGKYQSTPEPNGMVEVWDEDQIEHYQPADRCNIQDTPPEHWVDTVCLKRGSVNM